MSSDWLPLHDRFYQHETLFQMTWNNIHLNEYQMAASSAGGAIALVRHALGSMQRPLVLVHTCSGEHLQTHQWDYVGKVVGLGWTREEQLICVLDSGTVRLYTLRKNEYTQFSLGQEARELGLMECRTFQTGLAALSRAQRFIIVDDWQEPHPRVLSDLPLNASIACWTVIEPSWSLGGHVEILVADTLGRLYIVDNTQVQKITLDVTGPFLHLSFSPDGRFLALLTSESRLIVTTSDLQQVLSELDIKQQSQPSRITWCGSDAVLLQYDTHFQLVGPFGDQLTFHYDAEVFLSTESDGVRVFSRQSCEFIQKVPLPVERALKLGSTLPAAILLESSELYSQKNPKSDEMVRHLGADLSDAVETCIEAALHSWSPLTQKQLLKAASFGQVYLNYKYSDSFVNACRSLRVLNAVRQDKVAMAMTFAQYKQLTPEILVHRLVQRHAHYLALKISQYLNLSTDRIFVHWACAKIQHSQENEETLGPLLIEKLKNAKNISYAEIARTAYRAGQSKLAIQLLDYEAHAAEQVPLLMSMQQDERALDKAMESGDTDLVHLVLLHLKRSLSLSQFFQVVSKRPGVARVLESYARQHNEALLAQYYFFNDLRYDSALLQLEQSFREQNLTDRINKLESAQKAFNEDKTAAQDAKLIEEHIRLLQLQQQLERDQLGSFVGKSLSETMIQLIKLGQQVRVQKMRGDFRVPEKRFWWLHLEALSEMQDFISLERFSKTKVSPIGYLPFVQTLIRREAFREAFKYVARCNPLEQRRSLYISLCQKDGSLIRNVAEVAVTTKDAQLAQQLQLVPQSDHALQELSRLLSSLTTTGR